MCSCANHIFALIDAKMILHIHLKGFLVHFINGVSDKACQNIASCTIVSTLSLILSEIVRILTGTCADLKDTHSKFQILLDIMDRSQKLDHTTLGSQMCIFIVCGVMVCECFRFFHDSTSPKDIKNGANRKLLSTCTVIIQISYNPITDYTEIWVRQYKPDESQ